MARFFVSCQLGFEKELSQELREIWMEFFDLDGLPTRFGVPEFEILQGGLELDSPEHLGFQINLFSKLANRVLLRIAGFECRYYDQFEKNIDKIKISDWISHSDVSLKIKVETSKSRLNNQKNLTEAFVNSLKRQKFSNIAQAGTDEDDNSSVTVYVRAHQDRFTVSLDTSGEHLHRRGYASFRGEAPIRETLASYMVRRMYEHIQPSDELLLVDLFCGSGTLLFEAASRTMPNLSRKYSFIQFKNCPKIFQSGTWKKNYRWLQSVKGSTVFLGVDRDLKAIKASEANKIQFQNHFSSGTEFNFINEDSEKIDLNKFRKNSETKLWCLSNPPYGIRVSDDSALKVLHLQESQMHGLALVHPINWKFSFQKLKLIEQTDFNNQGIHLKYSVFKTS